MSSAYFYKGEKLAPPSPPTPLFFLPCLSLSQRWIYTLLLPPISVKGSPFFPSPPWKEVDRSITSVGWAGWEEKQSVTGGGVKKVLEAGLMRVGGKPNQGVKSPKSKAYFTAQNACPKKV
jgi:hypothetical protein